MNCRSCNNKLKKTLFDLGKSPIANSLLSNQKSIVNKYNLKVFICEKCWLLQTNDLVNYKEIFKSDYPYFSGYSNTWLNHLNKFVKQIKNNFPKNLKGNVYEIASNDGCLLNILKKNKIKAIGIEPTKSTFIYSKKNGHEVINSFFTNNFASKTNKKSDFIIANNVLAHVPNLNDFVVGIKNFLNFDGVATFEIQYLINLIRYNQFDTIYHEHFSYFSITAATNIFKKNGLKIFDCVKIRTHGGSIRLYVAHSKNKKFMKSKRLNLYIKKEVEWGVNKISFYKSFENKIKILKKRVNNLTDKEIKRKKIIAAYGAAAKANTFFNFMGIDKNIVKYIVDKNPHKIGMFLPGSKIPIKEKNHLNKLKPDFIFIMAWNIKNEIIKELKFTRKWGCKFITFIPNIKIF